MPLAGTEGCRRPTSTHTSGLLHLHSSWAPRTKYLLQNCRVSFFIREGEPKKSTLLGMARARQKRIKNERVAPTTKLCCCQEVVNPSLARQQYSPRQPRCENIAIAHISLRSEMQKKKNLGRWSIRPWLATTPVHIGRRENTRYRT